MEEGFSIVVLAGGLSTRFKSEKSKLLHELSGRPILGWVLHAVRELDPLQVVVVHGKHNEHLREHFQGVDWALQPEPRGTADALVSARTALDTGVRYILLISGDTPLIATDTLKEAHLAYKAATDDAKALVLTASVSDPEGYGRIVRTGQRVESIVEEADASASERQIKEINSGIYFLELAGLWDELEKIGTENAKGEMYLTDLVARRRALIFPVEDGGEILGINTRADLAQAESTVQGRIVERLMTEGVSFIRPDSSYIEVGVSIAPDTIIYPGTYLLGQTTIGSGSSIGPNTLIEDCTVGENCRIIFSQLHRAQLGSRVKIGPYSNVRPDTVLDDDVKLGDFVEIKKTRVRRGSKIPHLSYVGDSEIGENVNIGAGTVTCNYDGARKHRTIIEDGAFIGSNSTLIAPMTIGKGAYVAAGSTITEDVPPDDLAVARGKQKNKPGYAAKIRARNARAKEKSEGESEHGS